MNQYFCERCGGLFNSDSGHKRHFCDECRGAHLVEYQKGYYTNTRLLNAFQDGKHLVLRAKAKRLEGEINKLLERAKKIEAAGGAKS